MTDTAAQIEAINDLRGAIKETAAATLALKRGTTDGEALANIMLAYRHLEDASMRLKALQALDGGVSVGPRTTVGA